MERLINVGVKEIIKYTPSLLSYNNEVAIIDFSESRKSSTKEDIRLRIDAISLILISQGEIKININGRDYSFNSRVMFDVSELHTFGQIDISPDCKGYQIIISNEYMKSVMGIIKKRPSLSTFLERCEYPVAELEIEEAIIMDASIQRVISSIKRDDHYMHNELVKNDIRGLFIEMINIISSKTPDKSDDSTVSKDRIIIEFVFLLNNHCLDEHSVDFYANKLCVDSKHLSRILKSQTNKTASMWINDALLKEAKIYLEDQSLTIQQIADQLNFSDQSSFGKFFKKHCKLSPSEYRKEFSR